MILLVHEEELMSINGSPLPWVPMRHYNWEAITAWMQGTSHRTPSGVWRSDYYGRRRRQAFVNACRNCDPELFLWPEFDEELMRLRLTKWYRKGTFSMEVAGLLIAADNRSIGPWLARSAWMQRRGKDPLARRRHNRSMHQFYLAADEARQIAKRREFEMRAYRATSLA